MLFVSEALVFFKVFLTSNTVPLIKARYERILQGAATMTTGSQRTLLMLEAVLHFQASLFIKPQCSL
jgi:hypothetical protein